MKALKKIIPICLLALVLIIGITLLTPKSQAVTIVDSGTCGYYGNNLTWTLDDQGVVTISGTGPMKDYKNDSGSLSPWYESEFVKEVIIEEGVSSIGDCAFNRCSNLQSVSIPPTVATIGYSAFFLCTELQNISIPYGVVSIKTYAFYHCEGLRDVAIPDSVITVDHGAFKNCTGLQSVTVGNGVTSLSSFVFGDCNNLQEITIGSSVTVIDENAFWHCENLRDVFIPDGVTTIGVQAFAYCYSLQSISIPGSVTEIGYQAFEYCTGLKCVEIPDGITSIAANTFSRCTSLQGVVIPDSVTTIGYGAFYRCASLNRVIIPDSVTDIGESAFFQCAELQSITIGSGVHHIGVDAFYSCDSLLNVYYYGRQDQWGEIIVSRGNSNLTEATRLYGHIHNYSVVPPVVVEPTCTDVGYIEYTCIHSDTYREYIPAQHTVGGDKVIIAPTCIAQGYTRSTCAHCGKKIKTDYVNALGHDFNGEQNVFTGCWEQGYTETKCTRCEATERSNFTPAPGCNEVWIPTKLATCTEEGITVAGLMCDRCQTVYIQPTYTPALGHTIDGEICTRCRANVYEEYGKIVDAAYSLGANQKLPNKVVLSGKITSIGTAYDADDANITVTIVVKGRENMPIVCYRMQGDNIDKIGLGDTVMVYGYIENTVNHNDYSTVQFSAGCQMLNYEAVVIVPNDMAQIVQDAYALPIGEQLPYKATLTGTINEVRTAYDTNYKHITTVIEIAGAEGLPITCYRLKGSGIDQVGVGDVITVTGYIENYREIRFVAGCILDGWRSGGALTGDLTGDNAVNNDDVVLLLWHTLFPEDYPLEVDADLTGDGTVNNDDVVLLLWHTLFPEDYPL